jgi:bifunctional non-homologous end joining protein LigD
MLTVDRLRRGSDVFDKLFELLRRLRERAWPHSTDFVEPCLPCPAKRPPAGRGWIHEIKDDGYHIVARRNDDGGCGCLPGGL